jgi:hypothetical protein
MRFDSGVALKLCGLLGFANYSANLEPCFKSENEGLEPNVARYTGDLVRYQLWSSKKAGRLTRMRSPAIWTVKFQKRLVDILGRTWDEIKRGRGD